MRLERYIRYIREEWYTRMESYFKNNPYDIDIFVNPTKRDMKELVFDCRFIADNKKKKLYVWDAWRAYHQDVAEKIFGSFDDTSDEKKLYGTAEQKGAKWKITSSDSYGGRPTPEEMMKKYKWMNKYIDINEFFNSLI